MRAGDTRGENREGPDSQLYLPRNTHTTVTVGPGDEAGAPIFLCTYHWYRPYVLTASSKNRKIYKVVCKSLFVQLSL